MSQEPSKRELGFYFSLAQAGLVFVLPTVVGLVLDSYLESTPWVTVVATGVGFAAGLTYLVRLLRDHDRNQPPDARP